MDPDTEFTEFMQGRWAQLVRLGYGLTGDRQLGEDLAQTALARAYASWPRVRRAGDPDAEPVVMLHGLGGTKASFLPTVSALADQYRVHSIDLPGFGGSVKPLRAAYDPHVFARAVGGFMNRNPIPIVLPCHRVVGASGKLVGYAGGLERKEQLLRLEGALL